MRKTVILSIILAITAINSHAQTYAQNKLRYDVHQYTPQLGDPYNPAVTGLCSFFVPGLGQMVAGETGRGFAFLGGSVGSAVLYGTGMAMLMSGNRSGAGIALIGGGAMLFIDIWSIVDAVKVAKVNNMYIRDKNKMSMLKVEFAPYVTQININNKLTTPVGLSMRVNF
jgi:TM2 domain-containing membrane protein YozV